MIALAAADARRFLAEEIRVAASIRSPRIIDALATIPRERFLPPGPWQIRSMADAGDRPRRTEDADPRHVYHDVAIAIDPSRNLYNGQPSLIARWLDDIALDAGHHVIHIGCGTGYFTAIMAHVVGPSGVVDAIDVDAELVVRARSSLADQPWVHVDHGNGANDLPNGADAIVVHAGGDARAGCMAGRTRRRRAASAAADGGNPGNARGHRKRFDAARDPPRR
jgi:protein-L-isoaspartate(D-aspartate) O-methyltransferase